MIKDITKKRLEEHTDVFADIFNALVFHGKEVIKAEDLTPLPTTEHHADENGVLRERTRDVFMENKKQGVRYLLLGGENQDYIDNTMPLRCMGFDFASYDKQVKEYMDQNKKENKAAPYKKIHSHQKLTPVITLVMYFNSTNKWDGPTDLYGMLEIPEELKENAQNYISNYNMNLVSMAELPPDVREHFKSDFRLVVEYLACKGNKEKIDMLMQNKEWKIDHVEDFLDVMGTIDNDKKFEKIKEKVVTSAEKEEITMFSIAEELENRGKTKGLLLAKTILKLDAEGKSISEIATECEMDEEEIRKFLEK